MLVDAMVQPVYAHVHIPRGRTGGLGMGGGNHVSGGLGAGACTCDAPTLVVARCSSCTWCRLGHESLCLWGERCMPVMRKMQPHPQNTFGACLLGGWLGGIIVVVETGRGFTAGCDDTGYLLYKAWFALRGPQMQLARDAAGVCCTVRFPLCRFGGLRVAHRVAGKVKTTTGEQPANTSCCCRLLVAHPPGRNCVQDAAMCVVQNAQW